VNPQSTDRPFVDWATNIGIGSSRCIEWLAVILDLDHRMSGLEYNANVNLMDSVVIVGVVDDIRDQFFQD